jgi:hypothetical protein
MSSTPQEPGTSDPETDPDVNPSADPTEDNPVPGSGAEDPGDPS